MTFVRKPRFIVLCRATYPIRHLLHLNLVASTNSTLVVAKNSDFFVTGIIELDFLLDGNVGVVELFQKTRHGVRGVVGTENLSTEARHVVC